MESVLLVHSGERSLKMISRKMWRSIVALKDVSDLAYGAFGDNPLQRGPELKTEAHASL